jgi:hypothetical protein
MREYNPNLWVVIVMVLVAWGMVGYARQAEHRVVTFPIDVKQVPETIAGFRMVEQQELDDLSKQMLTPDAYIVRNYANAAGYPVNVLVIYGHQKNTFHSPGYCLPGGGWAIQKKDVERLSMVAPDGAPYSGGDEPLPVTKRGAKAGGALLFYRGWSGDAEHLPSQLVSVAGQVTASSGDGGIAANHRSRCR